jgi:hypothetical protein
MSLRMYPSFLKASKVVKDDQEGFVCFKYGSSQGGILFWLRGSLHDRPGVSPEIEFIKIKK